MVQLEEYSNHDNYGLLPLTIGSLMSMLCLVMLGLKFPWFRARMDFAGIPTVERSSNSSSTNTGVYAVSYRQAADIDGFGFDYVRPAPTPAPSVPVQVRQRDPKATSSQLKANRRSIPQSNGTSKPNVLRNPAATPQIVEIRNPALNANSSQQINNPTAQQNGRPVQPSTGQSTTKSKSPFKSGIFASYKRSKQSKSNPNIAKDSQLADKNKNMANQSNLGVTNNQANMPMKAVSTPNLTQDPKAEKAAIKAAKDAAAKEQRARKAFAAHQAKLNKAREKEEKTKEAKEKKDKEAMLKQEKLKAEKEKKLQTPKQQPKNKANAKKEVEPEPLAVAFNPNMMPKQSRKEESNDSDSDDDRTVTKINPPAKNKNVSYNDSITVIGKTENSGNSSSLFSKVEVKPKSNVEDKPPPLPITPPPTFEEENDSWDFIQQHRKSIGIAPAAAEQVRREYNRNTTEKPDNARLFKRKDDNKHRPPTRPENEQKDKNGGTFVMGDDESETEA